MGNLLSTCWEDEESLPPIVFYSLSALKDLRHFPRSPQEKHLQTELSGIDREKNAFVFLSHCWKRGYPGAKGYNVVVPPLTEPKPHPDTPSHDKFQLLITALEKIKSSYFPDIEEVYVWIDYGCINQDASACLELKMLDKIMGACDIMLTTIHEENWSREWWDNIDTISDWFKQYGSPDWNQGDHAYLSRAWCLVEMMYASNIPLLESSSKRLSLFRAGLLTCIQQNRRPHLLMGTNEAKLKMGPVMLPPMRDTWFDQHNPVNGKLSVEADRVAIRRLVEEANVQRVQEGYEGERNAAGKRHGQGVSRYADGNVYEGEIKDGKRHGQGVLTGPDGSILHNGEWRDGKQFGKSYPKDRCGWITKKGHIVPSWKRRYFTLKCGLLQYYTEESCREEMKKGSVEIDGYSIDTNTSLQIYLSPPRNESGAKNMHLKFDSEEERQSWMIALRQSV